jgi:uncharacterized membrane protein YraQ (UPF0718 family)
VAKKPQGGIVRLNVLLMCAGLGFLAAALYRMGAIKFDRKFVIDLLPLIIATITLVVISYWLGGQKLMSDGGFLSIKMIFKYAPVMTIVFVVMGQATAIIDLYRPALMAYLAGKQGIIGSLFAAYLMPGGLTSMPIVRDLWDKGANPVPLLTFTLASGLVNWQIAMVRQPILGWKFTAISFCLGSVVACAITGCGWIYMAMR